MITINGVPVKWGTCQCCRLSGLLRKKYVIAPGSVTDTAAVPEIDVCVTCYHTPAGILSDNQTHQRLPKEEYLVK